jgi:glyoxylase-like metal-dependent hydrolase (beta-lactamase superfamily II)
VSAGASEPFDDDARAAILHHMNGDHAGDNLVIVRANGAATAVAATMTEIDAIAGVWIAQLDDGDVERVIVPWTTPLTDRRSARVQIVEVHTAAQAQLSEPS